MSELVVGVDGSDHSLIAVEWAVGEAARRDSALHIVCAIPDWMSRTGSRPGPADAWRDHYRAFLDRAADWAREAAPEAEVSVELTPGQPAATLLKAAEHAVMLVVAGHGAGQLSGLLLGSTVLQVVAHAACPVAVVNSLEPPVHREVVVGVDGSEASRRAIDFAFQEASLRKAKLRALHAWHRQPSSDETDVIPLIYDLDDLVGDERRLLAESLAGRSERYPDVEVVEDTVQSRPVRALAGASARADLLVVGRRGRGGFAGLRLGSVSQGLLVRSHCPLVIVPEP